MSVKVLSNIIAGGPLPSVPFVGTFTKVGGTSNYTINHARNNSDAVVEMIRDSDGTKQNFNWNIVDADNIQITGVTDAVPVGTFSVNIVFAS